MPPLGSRNTPQSVNKAMAIMVLAMLIAPFMDAIAKTLAVHHDLSPAFVTFSRFTVQTLVLGAFVFVASALGRQALYLSWINIARGMLMGLTAMVFFTAIKYMQIGRAHV